MAAALANAEGALGAWAMGLHGFLAEVRGRVGAVRRVSRTSDVGVLVVRMGAGSLFLDFF